MTAQAHRCVYAGRAAQQGEQKQGAFADAPFFPLRAPFVKEDREHPGEVDRGEVDQYNFHIWPLFSACRQKPGRFWIRILSYHIFEVPKRGGRKD